MCKPEGLDLLESVLRSLSLWETSFEDSGVGILNLGGVEMHVLDVRNEVERIPEPMRTAVLEVYVNDMTVGEASEAKMRKDAKEGLEYLFHRMGFKW